MKYDLYLVVHQCPVLKIEDLQAHNATHCELVGYVRSRTPSYNLIINHAYVQGWGGGGGTLFRKI